MAEQCHCAVDYSGADCLLYTRHSSKGPNIKRCYIKPPDSCVCTETEKVLQHNSRKCRRARRLISVRTQFDAVSHKLVQHLPWIIYRSRLCLLLRRECRPVHRKHQHVGWEKEEGDGDHFLSLETGSGQDQPVPFYYVIFFPRATAAAWSAQSERLKQDGATALVSHNTGAKWKQPQRPGLQECCELWCLSNRREDVDSPLLLAPGKPRGRRQRYWDPVPRNTTLSTNVLFLERRHCVFMRITHSKVTSESGPRETDGGRGLVVTMNLQKVTE